MGKWRVLWWVDRGISRQSLTLLPLLRLLVSSSLCSRALALPSASRSICEDAEGKARGRRRKRLYFFSLLRLLPPLLRLLVSSSSCSRALTLPSASRMVCEHAEGQARGNKREGTRKLYFFWLLCRREDPAAPVAPMWLGSLELLRGRR